MWATACLSLGRRDYLVHLKGLANGSRIHRGWYLSSLLGVSLHAATLPSRFSEPPVAAATISAGTSFDFAPDGRIVICEQAGAVRVIKNGVLLAVPFTTFSVDSTGERGLLGIAFDPDFAVNQHVYFYYTVSGAPTHNRVVRVTASGGHDAAKQRDADISTAATNHNGRASTSARIVSSTSLLGKRHKCELPDVG